MNFDIELVGKIGSMALIDKQNQNIDYNKFALIGRELKPGMIWISSGATEIGRIDYLNRMGKELTGSADDIKTDYAAQGQAILMRMYRDFVDSKYAVRQVLVEHQHFNDEAKRKHIHALLLRAAKQNAIPIINYNDAVSSEENRKMEINSLRQGNNHIVELVDNDETASQIACLVKTRVLVILTSVDGIYSEIGNPASIIKKIGGKDAVEVIQNIEECKKLCKGSSRAGSNGAEAKLEFVKEPVKLGTTVYIANAKYPLKDILSGAAPSTVIKAD